MTSHDLYVALIAFAVGGYLGIWSEARNWREKAKSGFRKASGGHLYRVINDADVPTDPGEARVTRGDNYIRYSVGMPDRSGERDI